MTVTIPASELQPGDKINFGGQTVIVLEVKDDPHVHDIVTLSTTGLWTRCPGSRDLLTVSKALMLTVERPEPVDPDAELVEAMAKAIHDTYRAVEPTVANWDDPGGVEGRDQYRHEARAALAVVRAAK